MQVLIPGVALVSGLRYHLFSLPALMKHDPTFEGHGGRSQANVRTFDRVSVEWDLLQPLRIPDRPQ